MLSQPIIVKTRVLRGLITSHCIPHYAKASSQHSTISSCWFSSKVPNESLPKPKAPHAHVDSKSNDLKEPSGRAEVLNLSFLKTEVLKAPAKRSKKPVSKPISPKPSPIQEVENEIADETIHTRQYPNGDVYVGQLSAANKHHGQGTITYAGGGTWKGEFMKGKQHTGSGYSIISIETGLGWSRGYYEGPLVAGIRQGLGKMCFEDGSYWEGEFRNGHGVTGKGYVPGEDGSAECVEKVDGKVVSRTLIPASEMPK